MAIRPLARGDTKHANTTSSDNHVHVDPGFRVFQIVNDEGYLVDPPRQLIHPSFAQSEGEGILTYDHNPDITRNFILSPATAMETKLHKTLGGTIAVVHGQNTDDVVIQEVWTATANKLSLLAEMFRTFYEFWITTPAAGEFLTWHPADMSVESYGVVITNVELGRSGTLTYREYRDDLTTRAGSYLGETFTLSMKLVTEITAPRGVVTLEGL